MLTDVVIYSSLCMSSNAMLEACPGFISNYNSIYTPIRFVYNVFKFATIFDRIAAKSMLDTWMSGIPGHNVIFSTAPKLLVGMVLP